MTILVSSSQIAKVIDQKKNTGWQQIFPNTNQSIFCLLRHQNSVLMHWHDLTLQFAELKITINNITLVINTNYLIFYM